MDVKYSDRIAKKVRKRKLPKETWINFRDAFNSLALTQNFKLFDIKKLVNKGPYVYYRLRIGKYRALFHLDDESIYIEDIGPRGEVYKP